MSGVSAEREGSGPAKWAAEGYMVAVLAYVAPLLPGARIPRTHLQQPLYHITKHLWCGLVCMLPLCTVAFSYLYSNFSFAVTENKNCEKKIPMIMLWTLFPRCLHFFYCHFEELFDSSSLMACSRSCVIIKLHFILKIT